MNIAFPAPEFSHILGNGTTLIYNYSRADPRTAKKAAIVNL